MSKQSTIIQDNLVVKKKHMCKKLYMCWWCVKIGHNKK